jgi:8-oxo-dGTP pyrophosphatase MutT (NUDIX family)
MQVIYANQEPPKAWRSAIFLAGPTPREGEESPSPSWRPEALKYLEKLGYDGVVFVPEDEHGAWLHNYDAQVEWEERCLHFADVILFWIPRSFTWDSKKNTLGGMPAFTTNDEWGFWKARDPMKLVLGAPEDAAKVNYQRYYAHKLDIPLHGSLEETCRAALEKTGDTSQTLRSGGERNVPLHVWRTYAFMRWYEHLILAGNRLDSARVEWVFRTGVGKQFIFSVVLHVEVFITKEKRHKVNEFIIMRPDIASVVLFERRDDIKKSRVALVKEFRSTVANQEGYVYELPGGSSIRGHSLPERVVADECREETGLSLPPHRFFRHDARQVAATVLTHRVHVYCTELHQHEMDALVQKQGTVYGVETDSERTQVRVTTYGDILVNPTVDWSTVGMISSILQI